MQFVLNCYTCYTVFSYKLMSSYSVSEDSALNRSGQDGLIIYLFCKIRHFEPLTNTGVVLFDTTFKARM